MGKECGWVGGWAYPHSHVDGVRPTGAQHGFGEGDEEEDGVGRVEEDGDQGVKGDDGGTGWVGGWVGGLGGGGERGWNEVLWWVDQSIG